jgi:hypothetical protein
MPASFFIDSPKTIPGVFVWMTPVSPCSSRPGLGSKVSRWLIAPRMKSVMMFVPEGSGSAAKPPDGSARNASTAVTPRAVRAIRAMARGGSRGGNRARMRFIAGLIG